MTIIEQFMRFEYPRVVSNFMQRYIAYEGTKGLIFLFNHMYQNKLNSILGRRSEEEKKIDRVWYYKERRNTRGRKTSDAAFRGQTIHGQNEEETYSV